ncbi:MAG: DUF1559 domain-containing protein [Gemmataceae bacterium]|nr:DUF1559 domain-containing protein [Gemmataceae bacterium]
MTRRGFSLVELLVVIGIVALLIGLTLPAIQKLRTSAHRSNCLNNLHNQAVAVQSYEATQGRLPPGAVFGPFDALAVPDTVSHGLYVCLLGYIDSGAKAADYRWDVSYFDDANQAIVRERIGVLLCPGSAPDPVCVFARDATDTPVRWGGGCNYGAIAPSAILADIGWAEPETNFTGALPANGTSRTSDIKDGAAFTILLAEQGDRGAAWASTTTLAGAREIFRGGPSGGGAHPGGFCVVMADGSARFLAWTIRPQVFAALCTRAGGESISADEF